MLKKPGPYPMIVLPPGGGYWQDGSEHECQLDSDGNPIIPQTSPSKVKLETDETAQCYRKHFLGKVRVNYLWLCFINFDISPGIAPDKLQVHLLT